MNAVGGRLAGPSGGAPHTRTRVFTASHARVEVTRVIIYNGESAEATVKLRHRAANAASTEAYTIVAETIPAGTVWHGLLANAPGHGLTLTAGEALEFEPSANAVWISIYGIGQDTAPMRERR